jgi:hypothetical protein
MNVIKEEPFFMAPEHQRLLAEIQRLTTDRMGQSMESVMRQADDYLFDRSGQTTEPGELTALRDLRRARASVRQTFESSMVEAFQRLRLHAPLSGVKHELRLVSEDALEEQLAAEQMVDSLVRHHAAALEMLDQRMAVLANRPAMLPCDNPCAPPAIAKALSDALSNVELTTAVRITLYKFMERELLKNLTPLYDRANARFCEAGILPRLLPTAPPPPETREPVEPSESIKPAQPAMGGLESAPSDHTLFSSLLDLLQAWRHQGELASPPVKRSASTQLGLPQLMSTLSLLQREPPEILDQASGEGCSSLGELLRREVLAGARRLGMGGDDIGLSVVQEDAVDLVGLLFDVLLDERDFEPNVRRKISRMMVPFVKVAVQDRRMFVSKAHPARRFLNTVAEACEGNRGDVPQERELLSHVDASIDKLVADFNEDVAIFETLEQELRAYMAQHRQRIEIAERRAAETQRGRERLETSRSRAVVDIAMRTSTRELPQLVVDLLTGYATHHLTQTGLRGGPESPAYAKALSTIDGLLSAFDAASRHVPVGQLPILDHDGLIEMLGSSGCEGPDADAAVDSIRRTLSQLASNVAAEPEVLPPPIPVVAEQPAVPPGLIVVSDNTQLDFDPEMAERIRALPIGTWLQLTGETGRSEPAKVSWVSPISSRLLFVNRRGARVLVASVEELAAMQKVGRVQLRPMGAAFDDALQQIMGRLQTKVAA